MSSLKITTTPASVLRQTAKPVAKISAATRQVIQDMIDSALAWEKSHPHELSAAMAAPQIGKSTRVVIIRDDLEDKTNTHFTAFINPEITRQKGKLVQDYEGCLSVPDGIYGLVPRYSHIQLRATLEDGHEVEGPVDGHLARVFQHEIDHLDGKLFIDRIRGRRTAFYRLDQHGELQHLDYDQHIANNRTLFPDAK